MYSERRFLCALLFMSCRCFFVGRVTLIFCKISSSGNVEGMQNELHHFYCTVCTCHRTTCTLKCQGISQSQSKYRNKRDRGCWPVPHGFCRGMYSKRYSKRYSLQNLSIEYIEWEWMRCIQWYSSIFLHQAMVKAKCVWHSLRSRERWCLSPQALPISSIFFNPWHTFACRQMWHSSASFVLFLVHENFKFQVGCCARWSSWDTRYRHFVKSGWPAKPVKPVKPVSPESRSQVEIDTLMPGFLEKAPRMTNKKPSCTESQRSTKARWNMDGTWMEHGWNMDGTWMEHGWNMDGTWMEHGWNIVALGCTWELSQLPEHFCDKSWSKENGAASSPSAALQFGLLRPGLPALLRMPEARKTEYFSLDRSKRCEARSVFRAVPRPQA